MTEQTSTIHQVGDLRLNGPVKVVSSFSAFHGQRGTIRAFRPAPKGRPGYTASVEIDGNRMSFGTCALQALDEAD